MLFLFAGDFRLAGLFRELEDGLHKSLKILPLVLVQSVLLVPEYFFHGVFLPHTDNSHSINFMNRNIAVELVCSDIVDEGGGEAGAGFFWNMRLAYYESQSSRHFLVKKFKFQQDVVELSEKNRGHNLMKRRFFCVFNDFFRHFSSLFNDCVFLILRKRQAFLCCNEHLQFI